MFFVGSCTVYVSHEVTESSGANLRRRIVTLIVVASLIVLVVIYFEREGNALYTGVLRFAVPLYALVLGMMVALQHVKAEEMNAMRYCFSAGHYSLCFLISR